MSGHLPTENPSSSSSHEKILNGAIYERTQILVQSEGIERLHAANVFLAGVGGVGGHCCEALVRAGIGAITICDHDVVSATNKNRQLIALDSNIGQSKVAELASRLRLISSHCRVTVMDAFLLPEDMEEVLSRQNYTCIVDCIDSVECKISLLETSVKLGIPAVFTSCGAGGRLDPLKIKVGDLFETNNDALARCCRSELRKRGIGPGCIQCVYSDELGLPPLEPQKQESGGRDRAINGTISYMPSMFGLHLSAMVIQFVLAPKKLKDKQKKIMKEFSNKSNLTMPWKTENKKAGGNNSGASSSSKKTKVEKEVKAEVCCRPSLSAAKQMHTKEGEECTEECLSSPPSKVKRTEQ